LYRHVNILYDASVELTKSRRHMRLVAIAGSFGLITTMIGCGMVESTPNDNGSQGQSTSASASSATPANKFGNRTNPSCSLISAEEIGVIVGVDEPTSVGPQPNECIFYLTPLGRPRAEVVTVRLTEGSGLPGYEPVSGLGYEAEWNAGFKQLEVLQGSARLTIALQLSEAIVPDKDFLGLAIRIFRTVEKRR
jgi:hypothetical protein